VKLAAIAAEIRRVEEIERKTVEALRARTPDVQAALAALGKIPDMRT
jgi:hypothetical protein